MFCLMAVESRGSTVTFNSLQIIDTVDLPVVVADHFPIARVGQCVSVVGRVVVFKCTEVGVPHAL